MRCEQIQPNLLEFSLRPSSCPEHETIRAHLGACEECRRILEQERKLTFDLSRLGPVGPVTDMWPVIRDRVRVRTPVWQGLAPWMMWSGVRGLAAAGIAVVFIAGVTFVGISQHSAEKKQVAAVSHLVEMQRQSQTTVAWTDDPLQDKTDRVLAALEGG